MAEERQKISKLVIDPGTTIGLVRLRVGDLARSRRFYEGVLAFQVVELTERSVVLGGQDKQPLLELTEVPGVGSQPRRATGLYHVAILFPTRADLGRELARVLQAGGISIGQGDHLVSEALYLSDPDGNGLELYQDRPREVWTWIGNTVQMAADPVDIEGLLEEGKSRTWNVVPAGTRIGHIHLQIGNVPEAERFYHGILGFDVTATMPGALFVSAGGYHHHIGLNTWHSQGAQPTPEDRAGLNSYVIVIPTHEGWEAIRARLNNHNIPFREQENQLSVKDPWQNQIILTLVS